MEQEIKKEAKRQFLKYFRVWFIVIGILAVIFIALLIVNAGKDDKVRNNALADTERVYDYGGVLSDEEEEKLRQYIAEYEKKAGMDIVLVTISEDVEGIYSAGWERAMRDYADDFYDNGNYGYDKVHGDGVLLLDNWYEGQAGSWLSTCGDAVSQFGNNEIDRVLDAVYDTVEDSPYLAYRAYVREAAGIMQGESVFTPVLVIMVLVITAVIAMIYAFVHLHQAKAKDTVTANAYVAGGKPVMNIQNDDFIRKDVIKQKIETGSGGSSGGGGGSHRSSSGVSHGGGGRRR